MNRIQALSHSRRPDDFSREPNLQTDIYMRLCLHDSKHSGESKSQNRRSNGRHVMLVQRGAIELHAVAKMISALGYHVTPVKESEKALLYFSREPFEVVISELDMPQLNGFQLAQRIRQHAPQTRILLMTACCQAEVVHYMNDRVVDGWLFKPFRMDVLDDMLKTHHSSQSV
jgi:DNA-binding response OmpR family regulator